MCEPCLFDEVRCYRLSVDQLTHRRYSGCFNKLSSRPTWLWCAVSPEHKTMFIQQASFFSTLTMAVVLKQPKTTLEIHDTNIALLQGKWRSEIKYCNGLVISFIALEFAV